jgi:hypothetical protein
MPPRTATPQSPPSDPKGITLFDKPATQTSSVRTADLLGHLCIFSPVSFVADVQTVNGSSDVVVTDVVDLDADGGTEYDEVWFFSVGLRNALKRYVPDGKVLARIGQGAAKPGKNAPWILLDATGSAADVAKATAYVNGETAKSFAPPPALVAVAKSEQSVEAARILAGLTPEQRKSLGV